MNVRNPYGDRALTLRMLNDPATRRRLGFDPRMTLAENNGIESLFDRPNEELDWPEVDVSSHAADNTVNPYAGVRDFGLLSGFRDWMTGLKTGEVGEGPVVPMPIMQPEPGVNDSDRLPSYEELGFDRDGPGTWGMFFQDPRAAMVASRLAKRSKKEAIEKYHNSIPDLVNGEGDAWRHARWNQLMTQYLGAERAKAFSDAYERSTWTNDDDAARLMDLHNNMIGRSLSREGDPMATIQNAISKGYIRTRPFGR